MEDILFLLHSNVRYLVLLSGVVAAVYALWGWLARREFDSAGRILGRIFLGFLDLQILLGIVLAFTIFYPALIGHITMMVLAAIVAHAASVAQKRRPVERKSFALQFTGIALALVLIVGGIMAIGRPLV